MYKIKILENKSESSKSKERSKNQMQDSTSFQDSKTNKFYDEFSFVDTALPSNSNMYLNLKTSYKDTKSTSNRSRRLKSSMKANTPLLAPLNLNDKTLIHK